MVRISKAKAIEQLQKMLNAIPELKELPHRSAVFTRWQRDTRVAIAHSFGDESKNVQDFSDIPYSYEFAGSESQHQHHYVKGLETATTVLESMIDEIRDYWEDDQSATTQDTKTELPKDTKRVFVIHGHDEAARETVARFLEKLGLEPVILHEQANMGRTIIEKFEDLADVNFAVVLLTPDDVGEQKDKISDLKPRARQNVILELGFFLGMLGRQHVCPLVKGDVEKPSDYDGVVYTELDDAGSWKMSLIQELKAADFDVDANQVFPK